MNVLEEARLDLHLSLPELWLEYFALGGRMDVADLGAYLTDETSAIPSDADHDAIVHALNEAYDDAGRDHAVLPYRAT